MNSVHKLLFLASDAQRPDPAKGPRGPCLAAAEAAVADLLFSALQLKQQALQC